MCLCPLKEEHASPCVAAFGRGQRHAISDKMDAT
jgi:hypothetical protein